MPTPPIWISNWPRRYLTTLLTTLWISWRCEAFCCYHPCYVVKKKLHPVIDRSLDRLPQTADECVLLLHVLEHDTRPCCSITRWMSWLLSGSLGADIHACVLLCAISVTSVGRFSHTLDCRVTKILDNDPANIPQKQPESRRASVHWNSSRTDRSPREAFRAAMRVCPCVSDYLSHISDTCDRSCAV